MKISVRKAYRSSKVIGFPVKSPAGENLRRDRGGRLWTSTLGASPTRSLSFGGLRSDSTTSSSRSPGPSSSFEHGEGESWFVLDTNREKLRALPGFDKKEWPSVAETDWDEVVDAHYRESSGS